MVIASGIVYQRDSQTIFNCQDQCLQDLGDNMCRGYKINIVTAKFLEAQHHVGQFPGSYRATTAFVADIKVLAKVAKQVTICKKDGSGSMYPGNGRFLPEVGHIT